MTMKRFYLLCATACYLLAAINLFMLFDRDALNWLNVAMAVYLCLGGVALSLFAWYEPIRDRGEGSQ